MLTLYHTSLLVLLLPLLGALVAGLGSRVISTDVAHRVTITGLMLALGLSLYAAKLVMIGGESINVNLYTWAHGGSLFPYHFNLGLQVDSLSVAMMVVVTSVSWLVHIYSIGYMKGDDGYQRFFSYISLFTFSMLILVMANNFLQLFLGWEAVGLVSYLLIGFWYQRESALQGSLKAFLVNRVGDFGFILGIALLLAYGGTLQYDAVFAISEQLSMITLSGALGEWPLLTVVTLLLFVGAMGKSAQIPLHVWLPESMEGPTPISALIHAATMVTAGIFMVTRMSPLYELSEMSLSVIMVIGSSGALWLGLIALVVTDIKRVVAYSTLSQLGYMMVAAGASAYSAAMFHLITHAFFKALLFLGAGSVIICMHHEQDMRKMGGLAPYMPITYVTVLLGSLALIACPPFSGFFSKDVIIEAVALSKLPGACYAHFCVTLGAFVTACYTFRAFFMTFHGQPRMDDHTREHLHESPWVVWMPLAVLAIPSVVLGWILIDPILFSDNTIFANAISVLPTHDVLSELGEHYHGPFALMLHSVQTVPFWLTLFGVLAAVLGYLVWPELPGHLSRVLRWPYQILLHKYGFDHFNDKVWVQGSRCLGHTLSCAVDKKVIDQGLVDGIGSGVYRWSKSVSPWQTGYLFHYISAMVAGLFILLMWLLLG